MKAFHQIYILFLKEVFSLNTILTGMPSCTERIMSSFPLEIQDRQKTVEETVLWSFETQRSSLHTGFSPQGIAFCTSGRILISL